MLGKMSFKKEIITELMYMYYDESFTKKLNDNRDLICFNNGIYDLKNKIFREGLPDDYISYCTNIDYIKYDK